MFNFGVNYHTTVGFLKIRIDQKTRILTLFQHNFTKSRKVYLK